MGDALLCLHTFYTLLCMILLILFTKTFISMTESNYISMRHTSTKHPLHECFYFYFLFLFYFQRPFTGDWVVLFLITLNGGMCCRNAGITRQPVWRAIHRVFYAKLLSDSSVTDLCFVSNFVISVSV